MIRPPSGSTLFPYTTLFRSLQADQGRRAVPAGRRHGHRRAHGDPENGRDPRDRKSTRLNSSHVEISYAVFCLKTKKQIDHAQERSIILTSVVTTYTVSFIGY